MRTSILSWADTEKSKRPPGFFGSIGGGLSTGDTESESAVEKLRVAGVQYVVVNGWYQRYRDEAALIEDSDRAAVRAARQEAQRVVEIYESIFAATVEVQRFGRGKTFSGGNISVLRVTNSGTM